MPLTLLQWNIWYKENIQDIAKEIKTLSPDIANLQELTIDSQFNPDVYDTAKYVAEALDYNYWWDVAQTWPDEEVRNKKAQGNGIFTRFPIVEKVSTYIQKPSISPKGPFDEGRVYVEAQLKIDSKILTIGTTHLSYTHKHVITTERKREIDNLINILNKKKSNFIFSADFNARADSYPVEQLSSFLKNCGPLSDQPTWTNKSSTDYKGWTEDKLRWQLDYVFATEDVKITSSRIVKTKYSDHLPILIEIELD